MIKPNHHNISDMPPTTRKRREDEEIPPSKTKSGDVKKQTKATKKAKPDNKSEAPIFQHWLVKSEPNPRIEKGVDMKFGFDDLKDSPNQTACWDGVRNYQARNFLRDQMKLDHDVFFYHSNCKEPGIVGVCKIVKESYPDHTQFDSKDPHYDSGSKKDNPRWFMVDVKCIRQLKRFISLAELKKLHLSHAKTGGPLANMALFTRARLSVQPLTKEEWDFVVQLEDMKT